jgi:hypothetical protein
VQLLIVFQLAFPENKNSPTLRGQPADVRRVSFAIPSQLWAPVLDIRLHGSPMGTVWRGVRMPKTSVNEDDLLTREKYQIRFARQVVTVQPVAKSHAVHAPSD